MPKRGDLEYAKDVKEAIRRIEAYTKRLSYQKFLKNIKTQDAVVRNLEIIGEAVKNISTNFKNKHKYVAWKNIAGMRDKLIHEYFGVNWSIVWDVVKHKLPELKSQLESIFHDIKESQSQVLARFKYNLIKE